MAMMDNVDFLISHIRNSFVTSDDTSMSEWIITECRFNEDTDARRDGQRMRNNNNNGLNTSNRSDSNGDFPSDSELKGSLDIHPDMDFGAHRRRSNTAQRLEKLKKDKRNQGKVKTVIWKDGPESYHADSKCHLFERKELPPLPTTTTASTTTTAATATTTTTATSINENNDNTTHDEDSVDSGTNDSSSSNGKPRDSTDIVVPSVAMQRSSHISSLTQQLNELELQGSNPFFKYAKFDGRTAGGVATKKLEIFIPFALAEQRSYPLKINVTAHAKGQEVVGLVCWQYTEEGRKPDLESVVGPIDPNDDMNKFSIHMAEDDGEIDTDFPPIVPTDPVSKYGFTKFAMVPNAPDKPKTVFVTIRVPNQGFNTLQVESMSVTMRELMEKIIKKRKIRIRPGLNYTLEKVGKNEAGKPIDLDSILGNMNCMEFFLIRENSSRGNVETMDEDDQRIAESLMSHQYKSYIVSMVHKLRTNTEVQLGISGEKIEIDPVSAKGAARLFRQKPFTYDADNVADCDIHETKSNGRSVFRLTLLNGHDYKQHYFEAEQAVANEIVEKVNNILELRFSPARKEFVFTQEKKALQKRDSIKYSSNH